MRCSSKWRGGGDQTKAHVVLDAGDGSGLVVFGDDLDLRLVLQRDFVVVASRVEALQAYVPMNRSANGLRGKSGM